MSQSLQTLAQTYLFADVTKMTADGVPEATQKRMLRLRDIYAQWLRYPQTTEGELVAMLKEKHDIGRSVAYEDVKVVKWCIGSMNQHSIDFERWLFVQRTEIAWQRAVEKDNLKAMNTILATRAKYMRLDREEGTAPDYSTITPPFVEISGDVSVAGFTPIPDAEERAKKLLRGYIKADAEDTEFEEIS